MPRKQIDFSGVDSHDRRKKRDISRFSAITEEDECCGEDEESTVHGDDVGDENMEPCESDDCESPIGIRVNKGRA